MATTAAKSLWSNCIVEHHNSVIEQIIIKIVDSSGWSFENALVWAISAQKALQSNQGFSPNQLVFGSNTNLLPSVLTTRSPVLQRVTPSQLISNNLNALHTARKLLIQCES